MFSEVDCLGSRIAPISSRLGLGHVTGVTIDPFQNGVAIQGKLSMGTGQTEQGGHHCGLPGRMAVGLHF